MDLLTLDWLAFTLHQSLIGCPSCRNVGKLSIHLPLANSKKTGPNSKVTIYQP